MELPSICFIYPYIFIGIFIIIHIVIFLLILKFIPNVEKLPFLWGMINWGIAIGVIYLGIDFLFPTEPHSLQIVGCFIFGIIPPITEDIGRFIVFTFIYKAKNHNFNNSLIFGAGHGGFESIVLMAIDQINNLVNFYGIKNANSIEELNENKLLDFYEKNKNGVTGAEIFGVITRFAGNFSHMGSSIIIYRLALNRKEKKYIIYFIVLLINHFINDTFSRFCGLYKLSFWYNFIIIGLVIMIIIIAWFVWKENNNKDYSDFNLENNEKAISLQYIAPPKSLAE